LIRESMSRESVAALFLRIMLAISCRGQEQFLREAARLDAEQKCDQAEGYYRKALEQGPPSAALLNDYGNHFLACGQPDRARAWFERLLKLVPAHSNANLQLARLETEQKHGSKALAYLANVKSDDPAIGLLRAEALHWAGQDAAAHSMLSSVNSNDPGIVFAGARPLLGAASPPGRSQAETPDCPRSGRPGSPGTVRSRPDRVRPCSGPQLRLCSFAHGITVSYLRHRQALIHRRPAVPPLLKAYLVSASRVKPTTPLNKSAPPVESLIRGTTIVRSRTDSLRLLNAPAVPLRPHDASG
jgi:hypothetical protein